LENTYTEAANQLLAHCLAGSPWPEDLLDRLIEPDGSRALFSIVVERLSDLFEPRLCDEYADLFAEVIARTVPGLHETHLLERYRRIRAPRKLDRDPASVRNVFVLSRVTLGADVAVTSVVLDGAKKCFPNAAIYFAGQMKGWELFAADSRLEHLPIAYGRSGSLEQRLEVWPALRESLCQPHSIIIDPDSRLTQLGLLPVCPEEDYFFFESRSYGGDSDASITELTQRWVAETFDVPDAKPYIAPIPLVSEPATVTISLGVGENPSKRVADPFEPELLRRLIDRNFSILIDRGAGGEEAARVERAIAHAGGNIRQWDGSFAGFAAQIKQGELYIGYDSAGGHVAAASGVPMISIFAGFPSERMAQRWHPTGPGPIKVIRATDPLSTLDQVLSALNPQSAGSPTL
jgi:ADP-heptose:LPS heptosyltransferase